MKDVRTWVANKILILNGAIDEAGKDINRMEDRNASGEYSPTIKQARMLSYQWTVQVDLLQDLLEYIDA
jgi:hypothetical protein